MQATEQRNEMLTAAIRCLEARLAAAEQIYECAQDRRRQLRQAVAFLRGLDRTGRALDVLQIRHYVTPMGITIAE